MLADCGVSAKGQRNFEMGKAGLSVRWGERAINPQPSAMERAQSTASSWAAERAPSGAYPWATERSNSGKGWAPDRAASGTASSVERAGSGIYWAPERDTKPSQTKAERAPSRADSWAAQFGPGGRSAAGKADRVGSSSGHFADVLL